MGDIDKLARELAEKIDKEVCDKVFVIKTALASYATDYCDSLLRAIADIRKKTGVGDKPMLWELADAILSAERDKVEGVEAQNAVMRDGLENIAMVTAEDAEILGYRKTCERLVVEANKTLSLAPSSYMKRIIPEGTIAARFIIGRGKDQKIVYWDADNHDDTGRTPTEAARAAGVEVD